MSRATLVSDTVNGARMLPGVIIKDLPCTIQPGRERRLGSAAKPAGVNTVSSDSMPAWSLYAKPTVRVQNGDAITDDLGRRFIVSTVYETPFGVVCDMDNDAP